MTSVSGPRVAQGSGETGEPAAVPGLAPDAPRRARRRGLPIPTRRAIVAAAIPSVVVFLVFWRWLGFTLPLATVLGTVWALASLLVTRSVYDDAELELAAWRAAAPELTMGPWSAPAERVGEVATPPTTSDCEPGTPVGVAR